MYRTDAVRQIGGWDEQLTVNETVDFDHRLRAAGWTIGYQPAMTVRWDVQERLGDLFAQYRRYGRGKAGMVRKNHPGPAAAERSGPGQPVPSRSTRGFAETRRRDVGAAHAGHAGSADRGRPALAQGCSPTFSNETDLLDARPRQREHRVTTVGHKPPTTWDFGRVPRCHY
jgi:hypothetical protein